MPKHSKNNTASGQFTYHERQRAAKVWGSSTARLSSLSQRPYDCCSLCLSQARDAVCCTEGHLFCRQCILEDLLSQKEEMGRQKVALETLARQEQAERERARGEARERALREFERNSNGLGGSNTIASEESSSLKRKASSPPPSSNGNLLSDLSKVGETAERIVQEAEEAAITRILSEQADARKKRKLPSFWLPSLTPSERQDAFALGIYGKGRGKDAENLEMKTVCRIAESSHPISIKSLIAVDFFRPESRTAGAADGATSVTATTTVAADQVGAACPTCKTAFTQSTNLYVMRRCGHTLCENCIETLVLAPVKMTASSLKEKRGERNAPASDELEKSKKTKGDKVVCAVCDKATHDLLKDVTPLQKEGTGFAAGGNAQTTKKGISFQA